MDKMIGARIKELRKARGWTQKDLSKKSGLNRVHISQLETGENRPTSYTLDALSKGFGMDLSVLFGDDSMVTNNSDIGLLPPDWKVVRLVVKPQGKVDIEAVHETAYWVGPKEMESFVSAYRVTSSDLLPSVA
ncbi:MAG: helix-turn-helix transcriptional regulator, partial [Candidatus Paceibacterota bacterium]